MIPALGMVILPGILRGRGEDGAVTSARATEPGSIRRRRDGAGVAVNTRAARHDVGARAARRARHRYRRGVQ